MRSSKLSLLAALLFEALFLIQGVDGHWWCWARMCPWHHKEKRGFVIENREAVTKVAILNKRQSVIGSDPTATTWELDGEALPGWAAIPFQSCGAGVDGTATICPTGYYCRCQGSGTNQCVPTGAEPSPTPTECSSWSGPTTLPECEFWWQTTQTSFASAYDQCGGFTSRNINSGWDTKTHCPDGYGCACQDFWFSQCLPTATATDCPPATDYWGCGAAHSWSSPTQLGDVCGGNCWTAKGFTHKCPGTLDCYTAIGYPGPGNIAACYDSAPATYAEHTYQSEPVPLCYPIPFTWSDGVIPVPTCGGYERRGLATPPAGAGHGVGTASLYSQCYGSTVDANMKEVPWSGPILCPAGATCMVGSPSWGHCAPVATKKRKTRTPVENPTAKVTPSYQHNYHYDEAAIGGVPRY